MIRRTLMLAALVALAGCASPKPKDDKACRDCGRVVNIQPAGGAGSAARGVGALDSVGGSLGETVGGVGGTLGGGRLGGAVGSVGSLGGPGSRAGSLGPATRSARAPGGVSLYRVTVAMDSGQTKHLNVDRLDPGIHVGSRVRVIGDMLMTATR